MSGYTPYVGRQAPPHRPDAISKCATCGCSKYKHMPNLSGKGEYIVAYNSKLGKCECGCARFQWDGKS